MAAEVPIVAKWFAYLNGRRISSPGQRSWTAEVDGIHFVNGDLWVQLTRSLRPRSTVVLHILKGATIEEVVTALQNAPRDELQLEIPHAA